ncbi:hypothetical protein ACFQ1S_40010, partial [Kibdelosporangium lantanae]
MMEVTAAGNPGRTRTCFRRVSAGELEMPLSQDRGGKLYGDLVGKRKQTKQNRQVVHGDLFGNVLFGGGGQD